MAKVDKILVGLLTIVCVALVNCDKVPVLIWNDKISHSLPKSLAGHSISDTYFKDSYLNEIASKKHNLVLFLQDKLSLDDISKYADVYNQESNGDTFKNLKNLMESYGSAHLPSVDLPTSTLSELKQKFIGKVHEIKDGFSTKDIPLASQDNLMLVKLPGTGNSEESYKRSLATIDGIIGKISSELKLSGKPFTALYTAQQNSHDVSNSVLTGRHLLDSSTDTFINVSNCVYIYARDVSFHIDSSNWTLSEPTTSGSCVNNTATLKWNYGKTDTLDKLEMTLTFEQSIKYADWKITKWAVSYSGTNSTTNKKFSSDGEDEFKADFIRAPLTFSYACGGPDIKVLNSTHAIAGTKVSLRLPGFQAQAFMLSGEAFGRDNNCVGFFDIGVWSMLVALFVLLLVLIPGIQMVASCKVMDRFDDPKGKTITVSASD